MKDIRNLLYFAAVMMALAILLALYSCSRQRDAATEARISSGQAGAAIESGTDAVGTIGNRADADAAADQITRENNDAIHRANGADAPVAADARAAGLRSLCKRQAYRDDPKCLRVPDSR